MTKRNPLKAVQKKAENAQTEVSKLAERLDKFKITPAQLMELQALEQGIISSKCAHSDVARQIRALQNENDARHAAVEQHFKMFNDRIAQLARDYGIEPDDPAKGKWDFNSTTGTFTKTS
ncbi:MAG: hypothetical protein A2Y38_13760 [Spirochaetes bacterium GWB1_59_5]|nr:MAG: hypothetical protein A2Y38_13760 [Spirochaetes bacterium GWB1_59_5]